MNDKQKTEKCKTHHYRKMRRRWWHKLIGIKDIYECSKCGYKLKVK